MNYISYNFPLQKKLHDDYDYVFFLRLVSQQSFEVATDVIRATYNLFLELHGHVIAFWDLCFTAFCYILL